MTFIESITAASQAYNDAISAIAAQAGISLGVISLIISALSMWALAWKGIALWKAAKKRSIAWFVILLVVNTIGILEILYIFIFSKIGEKKQVRVKAKGRKR